MKKSDLYKKLQNIKPEIVKKLGISFEEIEYIKEKLLNDKLGLKINFTEIDEKLDDNYVLFQEESSFAINPKEKNNNLLIEGENYYALKALKTTGVKVDVIYIDPPYNTGKEFIYDDDYSTESKIVGSDDPHKHSKWLSFMKRRLEIARELLTDDGVIFVSIDDNEQAYLKVLMDEIFGEKNFVSTNTRVINKGKSNDAKLIVKETDYILIYCKNINQLILSSNDASLEGNYNLSDKFMSSRGKYQKRDISDKVTYSKGLDFEIIAPDGSKIYPGYVSEEEWIKRTNNPNKRDYNWRWNQKAISKGLEQGFAFWEKTNNGFKLRRKIYYLVDKDSVSVKRSKKPSSIIEQATNTIGTNEIKNIFGTNVFDFPKPVSLIKYLIDLNLKNDSIILDFFAGSGTTAQAVMELNKEDGGNRRFILVTNNENDIAKNITRERIFRVINGVGSKGEEIKWEYSKDIKSLKENYMKYLTVKLVDKFKGEYEEIDIEKKLYKNEFDKDFSIRDFKN